MNKIWLVIIAYAVICILALSFVLAALGSYEDNYTGEYGEFYVKESMHPYEYFAFRMMQVFLFPLGSVVFILNPQAVYNNWLPIAIIDLTVYFWIVIWVTRAVVRVFRSSRK